MELELDNLQYLFLSKPVCDSVILPIQINFLITNDQIILYIGFYFFLPGTGVPHLT